MPQLQVPAQFDSHTLAEYVEAAALVEGLERLTPSEILQRFPLGQRPSSGDVEFAVSLVSQRSKSLGTLYPFTVDHDESVLRQTSSELYDFLLLMSLDQTPLRLNGDYKRSDPLFDGVVCEAFKALLGSSGKTLIFGWPPRDGRPSEFVLAVSWVAERMGLPELNRDRPNNYLDAGVDVIAWQPFSDGRTGFLTYLVQNTVRAEFASKPKDVEPAQWHEWIKFGTLPVVGFAVPFSIPHGDDRWTEIGYSATVTLDRSRIVETLSEVTPELKAKLREFNTAEIRAIAEEDIAQPAQAPRVRKPKRQRRSPHYDERSR